MAGLAVEKFISITFSRRFMLVSSLADCCQQRQVFDNITVLMVVCKLHFAFSHGRDDGIQVNSSLRCMMLSLAATKVNAISGGPGFPRKLRNPIPARPSLVIPTLSLDTA